MDWTRAAQPSPRARRRRRPAALAAGSGAEAAATLAAVAAVAATGTAVAARVAASAAVAGAAVARRRRRVVERAAAVAPDAGWAVSIVWIMVGVSVALLLCLCCIGGACYRYATRRRPRGKNLEDEWRHEEGLLAEMLEEARADPNGDAAESLALLQEAVELTMEPVASGGSRLDLKKSLNSLLEARHGPVLSESLGAALAASAGQKNDFSEAAQIDVLKEILGPAAVSEAKVEAVPLAVLLAAGCLDKDAGDLRLRIARAASLGASGEAGQYLERMASLKLKLDTGAPVAPAATLAAQQLFHATWGRPPPDEAEALALLKQVIEEADGRHREGAAAAAVLSSLPLAAVEAFSGGPLGEANAEKEEMMLAKLAATLDNHFSSGADASSMPAPIREAAEGLYMAKMGNAPIDAITPLELLRATLPVEMDPPTDQSMIRLRPPGLMNAPRKKRGGPEPPPFAPEERLGWEPTPVRLQPPTLNGLPALPKLGGLGLPPLPGAGSTLAPKRQWVGAAAAVALPAPVKLALEAQFEESHPEVGKPTEEELVAFAHGMVGEFEVRQERLQLEEQEVKSPRGAAKAQSTKKIGKAQIAPLPAFGGSTKLTCNTGFETTTATPMSPRMETKEKATVQKLARLPSASVRARSQKFQERLLEAASAVEHSLSLVDHLIHPAAHGGSQRFTPVLNMDRTPETPAKMPLPPAAFGGVPQRAGSRRRAPDHGGRRARRRGSTRRSWTRRSGVRRGRRRVGRRLRCGRRGSDAASAAASAEVRGEGDWEEGRQRVARCAMRFVFKCLHTQRSHTFTRPRGRGCRSRPRPAGRTPPPVERAAGRRRYMSHCSGGTPSTPPR